jgi:hypothetical protein
MFIFLQFFYDPLFLNSVLEKIFLNGYNTMKFNLMLTR